MNTFLLLAISLLPYNSLLVPFLVYLPCANFLCCCPVLINKRGLRVLRWYLFHLVVDHILWCSEDLEFGILLLALAWGAYAYAFITQVLAVLRGCLLWGRGGLVSESVFCYLPSLLHWLDKWVLYSGYTL